MFISTIICSAPYVRHCIYVSTVFPRAKPRSHFCGAIQIEARHWFHPNHRGEVETHRGSLCWSYTWSPGKSTRGATFWVPYGWGGLKRFGELYGEDDHDFLRPQKIIQNGATVSPNWNGLGIQELGLEDLKDISRSLKPTLPETNIAPTNGWLEYKFPFGMAYFQGLC